jgi:hypothetical protein
MDMSKKVLGPKLLFCRYQSFSKAKLKKCAKHFQFSPSIFLLNIFSCSMSVWVKRKGVDQNNKDSSQGVEFIILNTSDIRFIFPLTFEKIYLVPNSEMKFDVSAGENLRILERSEIQKRKKETRFENL